MREDLAREFPEALRGAEWVRTRIGNRRLALSSEPLLWATVSGIGAGFLVSAVAQAVVGLANEGMQALRAPTPFPLFPAVTIASSAAAAAVALGAGGPVALVLELVYAALGIAVRIPGLMTFCERAGGDPDNLLGGQCTSIGFLTSLWPQVVGIGLGLFLARAITTRNQGINSLLRVAGAFAIALFVVSHVWAASLGPMPSARAADALNGSLTMAAAIAAAAVAAGVVAAHLPGGVRGAAIVAAIWLVPWLVLQVPWAVHLTGPIPPENMASFVVSIVIEPIASAFLVLTAAVATRSRFVPREPG